MSASNLIEASYSGPIPDRERGIVRFGSKNAVENARARAMIHHLSIISLKVLEKISHWGEYDSTSTENHGQVEGWRGLREDLRFYLLKRAEWKRYLRKLNTVSQIMRCLSFA